MKLIIPGIGITLLLGWMIVSVSPCPPEPQRKSMPPLPPTTPKPRPRPKPGPGGKALQPEVIRTRGDKLILPCVSPLEGKWNDVKWFKNGTSVKKADRISGGTVDTPDLTFKYVTDKDSGRYVCSTSSPKGKRNGTTVYTLIVEDCTPGFYGSRCANMCGNCEGNVACHTHTGHCAGCQPNWHSPLCQQLLNCSHMRYGRICEYECGQCSNNLTCNFSTGYCKSCQSGWLKPLCQVEEAKGKNVLSAQTVALSVGIGAPATLGAIAGLMQLIKCLSSGLPTMPTCGREDSEEKLEDEVIPSILQSPDQQHLLNALPMQPLPTGMPPPASEAPPSIPGESLKENPNKAEKVSSESESDTL